MVTVTSHVFFPSAFVRRQIINRTTDNSSSLQISQICCHQGILNFLHRRSGRVSLGNESARRSLVDVTIFVFAPSWSKRKNEGTVILTSLTYIALPPPQVFRLRIAEA